MSPILSLKCLSKGQILLIMEEGSVFEGCVAASQGRSSNHASWTSGVSSSSMGLLISRFTHLLIHPFFHCVSPPHTHLFIYLFFHSFIDRFLQASVRPLLVCVQHRGTGSISGGSARFGVALTQVADYKSCRSPACVGSVTGDYSEH